MDRGGLPIGLSDEDFERMLARFADRHTTRSGYSLLLREPDEGDGKSVFVGPLVECREFARELVESGEAPEGSLLYIVVRGSKAYPGGIYEGYEVVDGKLVKGYKKYPWRMGQGGYGRWGGSWMDESDYGGIPGRQVYGIRKTLKRIGVEEGSEEWKQAFEELAGEDG